MRARGELPIFMRTHASPSDYFGVCPRMPKLPIVRRTRSDARAGGPPIHSPHTCLHTVGISDCAVTNDIRVTLVTYALGSCIAVTVYDPVTHVAGLLHYMLPDSLLGEEKAKANPWMFADTGIPHLFLKAYAEGASKGRLKVSVIGGAQVLGAQDSFQIGKRNHMAARKILWRAGVMVHREDVGGQLPRTVHFEVETGRVVVSHAGEERELVAGSLTSEGN